MQAPMHNTHTHTCRVVYQGTGAEVKVFSKRKHEPGEVLFAAAVAWGSSDEQCCLQIMICVHSAYTGKLGVSHNSCG